MELRILVERTVVRLVSGFLRRFNSLLRCFRMPRPDEPDTPTSSSDLFLETTNESTDNILVTVIGDMHSFLNLLQEGRLIICDKCNWKVVAKLHTVATPASGDPSRAPESQDPTVTLRRDGDVPPMQTADAPSAQDAGLISGCTADSASGRAAGISSESPSGQTPSRRESDSLPECPSIASNDADVPSGNAGISSERDADVSSGKGAGIPPKDADIPQEDVGFTSDANTSPKHHIPSGNAADMPSGQNADIPSEDADIPAGDADIPAGDADIPAGDADIPAGDADVPAGNADVPAGNADVPAGNADVPAGECDVPSAGGPENGPDVPPK